MAVPTMLRIKVRVTCKVSGLSTVLAKTEMAAHLHVLDDCICTVVLEGKANGRIYPNADIIQTELYYSA